MADAAAVFDRAAVRRQRTRAAPGLGAYDFLIREAAGQLAERLADVSRRFPLALDLGAHTGQLGAALAGRGGIETLVSCELAEAQARRAAGLRVVGDEEWLPFGGGRFDLALSCLSLHWVNDLPGTLLQIRRCLKPDGLFLAAMLGGETLRELRQAWLEAEAAAGGAGPRVSPFVDLRDLGGLLQRAGFALPVADAETLTVTYSDPLSLMRELRGMGESNAVALRPRRPLRRDVLMAAARVYYERHAGPDGRVPATFQVLYALGWAPAESQPKPLRPGSATGRLADALGTEERAAGDTANPKKR